MTNLTSIAYSEKQLLNIARICHNVNRAYCEYCESMGDFSQVDWEDAPEWQKRSALSSVKLHINHASVGPSGSHESWMAEKLADGWVYGEVKNAELKQHPCLVPFGALPREQQAKDFIFRAIVHELM